MTDTAYPPPTISTVKRLYGSAFRCAHPECRRPLYRLTDDTGDRVRNSEVAHIHARRVGGPRWLDMPAEENRGFDNLVLLCIEHATEIDETPERFPAEMLREWKAAQLAEYDHLQQSWPISDDEAIEALVASEAFDVLHAPSTVELVRRTEALRLVAQRTRGLARAWARRWQQLREQTRRSFVAWDENGNPVYAEPAEIEVRPLREGIRSALDTAVGEVQPAAEAARVELAAVRVTRTQTAPWCDAVDRAIGDLLESASTWTGGPDPAADGAFDAAVAELGRTVTALVRASRGEDVAAPAIPEVADPPVVADPLASHRALLDEARPFHRVHHRPYDPDLRERVAAATREAAQIPPIMTFSPIGLDVTAALAVAVAGNASEAEQLDLVERDRQRLPLCAAVALLQETARRDRASAAGAAAAEQVHRLWTDTDWAIDTAWLGNDVEGRSMMYAFARVASNEEVRDRLTLALRANPRLVNTLVISCAGWVQHLDFQTGSTTGFDRTYRETPPWLPVDALRELGAGGNVDESRAGDAEVLDVLLRRALADLP
jgi:hypothetical protein